MIGDHPSHRDFVAKERQKLVALCQAMLSGEISFFEGAIKVSSLRQNIEAPENDSDLEAFSLIVSETDHLPLKDIQHRWSAQAIERLRPEFEKTEVWAKPFASVACESLIKRFAMQRLAHVAPEFVAELEMALLADGLDAIAQQLPNVLLREVSRDRTVHMGYIYVQHPGLNEDQWWKAKESISTLCFADPYWFNIDLDVSDRICGVELAGRGEFLEELASSK